MNLPLILSLLAVTAAAAETRWNLPSQDGVSVLSDDNFAAVVARHPYVFVMFSSPECPHCKKALPELVKLAKKYDDEKKDGVIAILDVHANAATAAKYGVTGFPSFRLFFHGIPIEYKHDRTEKHFAAWLNNRLKDRAEEITTLEAYKKVEGMKLAGLMYLGKKNKRVLTNFQALAAHYVRVPFYYTYLDKVQEDLGVTGDVAMAVYRTFDDGRKVLSAADLTYDVMHQFFENLRLPAVPELDTENAADIFGPQKAAAVLFTDSDTTEAFQAVQKAAKSKKWDLTFAWTNGTSPFGKKVAELLGVTEHHKNELRLMKFGEKELSKYKLATVTEDSLNRFMQDYKDGKLSKYQKSAAPKTDSHAPGKVWEVTGHDFEQLVLSSPQTVLLNIYSHDCKHCEETHQVLEKLAAQLKDHPEIVIAQFNGYANEHPALTVHGYPTIKLFRKGRKSEPVDFRGNRTLRNLGDFLKREMGSEWKAVVQVDDESL